VDDARDGASLSTTTRSRTHVGWSRAVERRGPRILRGRPSKFKGALCASLSDRLRRPLILEPLRPLRTGAAGRPRPAREARGPRRSWLCASDAASASAYAQADERAF
jgi:hypothetical protein